MSLRTYSGKDVVCTFGGTPLIDGIKSVKYNRVAEKYGIEHSIDGETVRSRSANDDFRVEIVCSATSPINDVLNAFYQIDVSLPNGAVPHSLTVENLHSNDSLATQSAFIMQAPEVEFGESPADRTWVFHACRPAIQIGGAKLSHF